MPQKFDLAGQPRISVEEARRRQQQGEAVLVDVRGADQYQQEHIAGAAAHPMRRLRVPAHGLPRDKDLILYCA